jgi:probable phosphomutase (TIGR03848 family)
MPTVVLVRHGRTPANTSGMLAGWTPGIALDEQGRTQAAALAQRLAAVDLAGIVTSPLQRCRETAEAIAAAGGRTGAGVRTDDRLGECRYGDWTGQELTKLAKDPLWKVVQSHPSAVVFPGADAESLRAMQERAIDAVREWNATFAAERGDGAVWAAVSHGDVIKAVAADALGMHLDAFQRIVVDPGSATIITYTPLRPFVIRLNDIGSDLSGLVPARRKRRRATASSDAAVGGGLGSASE